MTPRILAIDDEKRWLENFRAWIPQKLAAPDFASSTAEACVFLRRCRYHVVLLDLSMDVKDDLNRSNSAIQTYLSTRPEGTTYLIISGTVQSSEAIDAAFHLNAFYIIQKQRLDLGTFREKVSQGIIEASKEDRRLLTEARTELTEGGLLEDKILRTLHPTGGAAGMYPMMDALFDRIAPVVPHRDRPHFEFLPDTAVGLVWSRQLGMAVSIVLASRKVSEETSSSQLAEWLGYPQSKPCLFKRDIGGVRVQFFPEPNVSDLHFNLPLASTAV